MREDHQVERGRQQLAQALPQARAGLGGASVDEHRLPRRRDDELGVALTHIQEVNGERSGDRIRRAQHEREENREFPHPVRHHYRGRDPDDPRGRPAVVRRRESNPGVSWNVISTLPARSNAPS